MVTFKIFTDIVKIGWVRVIYDGSGNFQVFSGFLWPKLRVPHCNRNVHRARNRTVDNQQEEFKSEVTIHYSLYFIFN